MLDTIETQNRLLTDSRDQLEELVGKRTSELQASNRELEAFCYSVSHDLRAPLRSINGFSQALLEDYGNLLDDDGRDYLKRVIRSATRMGQLIDDLLSLARVVRRHGGRIRARAAIDQGASFYLTLDPENIDSGYAGSPGA